MKKKTKINLALLAGVIILVLIPFIFVKGAYEGSDDQGTSQIKKFDPTYKVWAHPLWTPPSSEIESLLFTVQGSFGTGVICYLIGSAHGKKKQQKLMEQNTTEQ